jgi:hypothetical protein
MPDIENPGSGGRIPSSLIGEMAEGCIPTFGLEFPD